MKPEPDIFPVSQVHQHQRSTSVGLCFEHFLIIDFDIVRALRLQPNYEHRLLLVELDAELARRVRKADEGLLQFHRRGYRLRIHDAQSSILKYLDDSIEESEPRRVIFPTRSDEQLAEIFVVIDQWDMIVAQAGLIGVGPQE